MGAYDETRLYEELERVTAEACVAATKGDGHQLATLVDQREALVELIQRVEVPVDAAAVRRILDLDRELLAGIAERRARLRQDLEELARAKRSLTSYAAVPPRSAVYLQRMG